MNIASLGSAQMAQTVAAGSTFGTPGSFGTDLQSLLSGQTALGATQSASVTEPGRGVPEATHRHRHSGSTDGGQPATDMGNSQTAATSAGGSQQSAGGLLVGDMMRGLQAYGATTSVA
jgi:hypothetical protein